MVIGSCLLDLHIPGSQSLKDKRQVLQRILKQVRNRYNVSIAELGYSDLWQRGWQLFTTRSDKEWGLTDCISFVVMQDYQIDRAFSSDRHFEQAGFVRLLK